ncbi:hypothetical protein PV394_17525 [Streptomyces sp. NE06-03E]|uniref:Uncharacterized protein n=3 Tax=Streptomyces TaxID=1883 RepID=A0ABU2RDK7_9ACTN|nr:MULTISPECIES: hypothetical protein [unclassified Streptomyces]MBK3593811.1 hypothetical protein [Streptomyces sp. MBT51]MDT0426587.1 hypothetical protein [Streptomyces sp. DSM 41770]MDX3056927.1 hypothetical protein [Streptomyces sp. NE06-03E]WSV70503.1 hypothetical protein OG623_24530 [Streptomyces sp. NBC_01012]
MKSRTRSAVHILTWLACDRRGIDKGETTPQRIAASLSDPLGQELDQ